MPDNDTTPASRGKTTSQITGLLVGITLAGLLQFLPMQDGLSREAWLLACYMKLTTH